MPIAHFYMPDQKKLIFPMEMFQDPPSIIQAAVNEGAVFATYPPQEMRDITPLQWAEEPYTRCRYILEMKRTLEAAKVHIFAPDEDGSPPHHDPYDWAEKYGKGRFLPLASNVVHIPAYTEYVTISHDRKDGSAELGAIILYTTSDYLATLEDRRQIPQAVPEG